MKLIAFQKTDEVKEVTDLAELLRFTHRQRVNVGDPYEHRALKTGRVSEKNESYKSPDDGIGGSGGGSL
ncbi:hypothetical protein E3E42_10230 [Thermococcus sp. JdF3]|nr:hypothetical protein [Thermococcus sp. JdF3]